MKRFFRTWYLLYQLRKRTAKFAMTADVYQLGNGSGVFFGRSIFLQQISEKMFFILKRSKKGQSKRMLIDSSILEACLVEEPKKTEERSASEIGLWRKEWEQDMGPIKENTKMIRTTGHGDDFSNLTNFIFVHLLEKYKWLQAVFVALVGWAWLPILEPLICKYIYLFNFCHT